jgi:hypothetical protein
VFGPISNSQREDHIGVKIELGELGNSELLHRNVNSSDDVVPV